MLEREVHHGFGRDLHTQKRERKELEDEMKLSTNKWSNDLLDGDY